MTINHLCRVLIWIRTGKCKVRFARYIWDGATREGGNVEALQHVAYLCIPALRPGPRVRRVENYPERPNLCGTGNNFAFVVVVGCWRWSGRGAPLFFVNDPNDLFPMYLRSTYIIPFNWITIRPDFLLISCNLLEKLSVFNDATRQHFNYIE